MRFFTRRDWMSSVLAAGAVLVTDRSRLSAQQVSPVDLPSVDFPLVDYHVHLSPALSIERAVELSRARGVQFGIVDHPGVNVGGFRHIETDDELRDYIQSLRPFPAYVGLQSVYPGWSKPFSAATLAQLDYILMDALTMPGEDGGWMYLWAADTLIEDETAFMEKYVSYIHRLLETERIDIFGWPTYLPAGLAREYRTLWTDSRVADLIDHARQKRVAIEINEVGQVPDQSFIERAKRAGLKFAFGTDARNNNAGRLSYCLRMAKACGLAAGDMFTVKRKS